MVSWVSAVQQCNLSTGVSSKSDLCGQRLLFDEEGRERDINVDFKRQKLHMSQGSTDSYDFNIIRKQKLPLLQMEPVTQDDLTIMIEQARVKDGAESVTLANINLVKMTYLHAILGHSCDNFLRKIVTHQILDSIPDLGKFPREGVKKFCDSCHR